MSESEKEKKMQELAILKARRDILKKLYDYYLQLNHFITAPKTPENDRAFQILNEDIELLYKDIDKLRIMIEGPTVTKNLPSGSDDFTDS